MQHSIDVTHHVIPSVAYVDLAWTVGDAQLAERHSERAFSMAMKSGSPYLRVYAQACRSLSHIVAGRMDEAIRDLVDALGFARRRKAGLENEHAILADLANAYRLKGDFTSSISAASEAINFAQRGIFVSQNVLHGSFMPRRQRALAGAERDRRSGPGLNRAEELVKSLVL